MQTMQARMHIPQTQVASTVWSSCSTCMLATLHYPATLRGIQALQQAGWYAVLLSDPCVLCAQVKLLRQADRTLELLEVDEQKYADELGQQQMDFASSLNTLTTVRPAVCNPQQRLVALASNWQPLSASETDRLIQAGV